MLPRVLEEVLSASTLAVAHASSSRLGVEVPTKPLDLEFVGHETQPSALRGNPGHTLACGS
jgi:hypothetical protein